MWLVKARVWFLLLDLQGRRMEDTESLSISYYYYYLSFKISVIKIHLLGNTESSSPWILVWLRSIYCLFCIFHRLILKISLASI